MFPEAKRAVAKKFPAIKQFKMFEIQMAPRAAREMFYCNVLNQFPTSWISTIYPSLFARLFPI